MSDQIVSLPRIIPLNLKMLVFLQHQPLRMNYSWPTFVFPSQFLPLDPLLSSFLCYPLCIPDPSLIQFMSEIVFPDPPKHHITRCLDSSEGRIYEPLQGERELQRGKKKQNTKVVESSIWCRPLMVGELQLHTHTHTHTPTYLHTGIKAAHVFLVLWATWYTSRLNRKTLL